MKIYSSKNIFNFKIIFEIFLKIVLKKVIFSILLKANRIKNAMA